jgi:murein DD-endopeptidase MepM/ murein hydrolase activator NlpD
MSPHVLLYVAAAFWLAVAGPPGGRAWPVAGEGFHGRPVVERAFEAPPSPYAAGHRGVDLRAAPGAPVRAAAAGRVAFAGPVAGRGVVAIALAGGLRITYQPVRAAVAVGEDVTAGEVVGFIQDGPSHCADSCLHWGLRQGQAYLDPLSLLPPWMLRGGPSRLLPVSPPADGRVPALRPAPWPPRPR